ncbi:hypothetical protein EC957_003002 [Mortierella hygrophila]|uniref:F-box domain-containing protein n=1 Tax=Mortierella hygrophila TaxID=979708 RepID=A0A9P6K1C4_9FUNG|nr:hypothetical protein EC957_003002 [Mortierella hygrophila]
MELQPAHIQALDLPEIMDLIGHHLSKGTLLNCIQVNRSWHGYFVPILWKSFVFSAYSSQPRPPVEALLKYAHHIRQLEFSGLNSPWYMSIGCKNLDFLKVVGERHVLEDSREDPLTNLVQENPGLQRLILYDVQPHPEEAFWDAVAGLTEMRSLIVNRTEIPPQSTQAFFRAISAYTPTLRLDGVYFKPIRLGMEEDEEDEEDEEEDEREERAQDQAEGGEQQYESSEETTQTEGGGAQSHEGTVSNTDNTDTDNTHDCETETSFFYASEVPPEVTFSRLKTLYMFDLTGAGYDKQPWILEHAPRLEHLSWRGGYDFEFPTESFTSALESGQLSRLESLELRGSHLKDPEIAQILSRMNRLVKIVAPRTELGPLAMKQLFQHYETVRELDISGCENVRSWMIQMFLCKFAALEVFMADMLSLQDITTDPWVCLKLRKLSLDFELGYVDKEEGVVEEEEEKEESDDDKDENWANVDAGEEGDNATSDADVEAEVTGVGEEEGKTTPKEDELTRFDEATAYLEQIVVETAIAEDEKANEQKEALPGAAATAQGAAIITDTTGDVVAATQLSEDTRVEGEEGEMEEAEALFTPEEIAAAMAVAQWDQQQMEADAAAAEVEENPDDLWKNLVPYVHSDERQRIIFERLGQLKYLEELNIKQQMERPYSAAEQLRAGVVQRVLDLSLDNGMGLLAVLSRLREFYFPGPQEMEEKEVLWIIEHWGGRLTHMTGELNRRQRVNKRLLRLLSDHHINAAMCML